MMAMAKRPPARSMLMMLRIIFYGKLVVVDYSKSLPMTPSVQISEVIYCMAITPQAARKLKMERMVEDVLSPEDSSSSSALLNVPICVGVTGPEDSGCVGGESCPVALGNAMVG
jgi:hypothetical protein